MAINEVHVGDIGTTFTATVKDETDTVVDISTVSIKRLIFCKPCGDKLTKTADFVTDGSDGKIKYVTVSGDLDSHGKWRVQGFVAFNSTEWYTDIHEFTVYRNL